MVCHTLIFHLYLWTDYRGASLILEKLFSWSSFYEIARFSTLASGTHFDPTITSGNIFRSSSIDAIMFSCGPHIWMLSCCRGLLQEVQDSSYNLTFKLSFIMAFFGWSIIRKVSVSPALSSRPFQNVQREVIYFLYVFRKKEKLP